MKDFARPALLAVAFLSWGCKPAPQAGPPSDPISAPKTGIASFYGREFAGKKTASGEPFKLDAMTAASRTLPLGSRVQVRNAKTGQAANVRINDRGPYAKGRLIDLTPRAAQRVGIGRQNGVAKVTVKPIFVAARR